MTEPTVIQQSTSTEHVEEDAETAAESSSEKVQEDTVPPQPVTDHNHDEQDETPKRYLPDHKKPDAAPTFPEKLMSLMRHVEKLNAGDTFCVAWCDGGKSFVINHPDDFTRKIVPLFFKSTKWSSFTRKLYRWGFRQINRGIGPDDPIIFGNEFFQRDKEELIAKMRSVTSSSGKQDHAQIMAGMKRTFGVYDEEAQKRMMFDHFLLQQQQQQQKNRNNLIGMQGNVFGAMNHHPNGRTPLNNALRPAMNVMGGPPMMTMMMVPRVQGPNEQSMTMNPVMNQMVGIPMMPGSMGQIMAPMNHPDMPQLSRFHPGQIMGTNGTQQLSQTKGQTTTQQQPTTQSTADIVKAAIAALRHAT